MTTRLNPRDELPSIIVQFPLNILRIPADANKIAGLIPKLFWSDCVYVASWKKSS